MLVFIDSIVFSNDIILENFITIFTIQAITKIIIRIFCHVLANIFFSPDFLFSLNIISFFCSNVNNKYMNQIIFLKTYKKKKNLYLVILIILIISIIFIIIYNRFLAVQSINKLHYIKTNYELTRLYASPAISTTEIVISDSISTNIIGWINIEKIGINYPIFDTLTEDLLKISICKLYGPNPNQPGNLCLCGHNFNNSRFFGRLSNLSKGDIINIIDNNNIKYLYYIYAIYEVPDWDTSCLSQDTLGFKEITLITCNNLSKRRLIVKARNY